MEEEEVDDGLEEEAEEEVEEVDDGLEEEAEEEQEEKESRENLEGRMT